MATGPNSRRRFLLLPLLFTFGLLLGIAGVCTIAYALVASSSREQAGESVEPTPDLDATVAAAIAMIPMLLTPSPVASPEKGTASNAPPIPTVGGTEPQSPRPPMANTPSPAPAFDRLPTIECPGCPLPHPPGHRYVEWVRVPKVSQSGVLSFRARIDETAGFVPAGPNCGFGNLTLTDDGAFYGAIIPNSMAIACGTVPGDWTSQEYHYQGALLTVRVEMDPVAAMHQGLKLCLWAGGMTEEQSRLLDCIPVMRP